MEQQILRAKSNHTIEGQLTKNQLGRLIEMAEESETINIKIDGFSVEVKIGRWQKNGADRLYINKSHSPKATRKLGTQSAFCYVELDGSIHSAAGTMNESAALHALAEIFGLEIYYGGGLRAVAE